MSETGIWVWRISSATNVGDNKDSEKKQQQRAAITAYTKSAGHKIID